MAPGLVSAEQRKRVQLESDDDSDVTCKRRWHWIVLKCVCVLVNLADILRHSSVFYSFCFLSYLRRQQVFEVNSF